LQPANNLWLWAFIVTILIVIIAVASVFVIWHKRKCTKRKNTSEKSTVDNQFEDTIVIQPSCDYKNDVSTFKVEQDITIIHTDEVI